MISRKKISILLHKKDSPFRQNGHLIWGIAPIWLGMGFQVEVLRGIPRLKQETDLLLPHIDLTRVPEAYADYLAGASHVLNRRVTDISKRRISGNLLSRNDLYDAPVIVKTDNNCGGFPELKLSPYLRAKRRLLRLAGIRPSLNASGSSGFVMDKYLIFPTRGDVPAEVWSNPELVVEKFIPERREQLYGIRVALFLGDIVLNRRLWSTDPVIKGLPALSETLDVPVELLEIRDRLGFDYGKIDYVVHQGKVHIIDANKTPGVLASGDVSASICGKLAKGIQNYL